MGAGKVVRNADESGHDGISELCRSLRRRQFETIVVRRPPGCPSDRIRSAGGTAPATASRPLTAPELALNGSALPDRPMPTRLESTRRKRTAGTPRGANSPSRRVTWPSRSPACEVEARSGRSPGLPALDPDGCPCGGPPGPEAPRTRAAGGLSPPCRNAAFMEGSWRSPDPRPERTRHLLRRPGDRGPSGTSGCHDCPPPPAFRIRTGAYPLLFTRWPVRMAIASLQFVRRPVGER
jgi:hypothetical protein